MRAFLLAPACLVYFGHARRVFQVEKDRLERAGHVQRTVSLEQRKRWHARETCPMKDLASMLMAIDSRAAFVAAAPGLHAFRRQPQRRFSVPRGGFAVEENLEQDVYDNMLISKWRNPAEMEFEFSEKAAAADTKFVYIQEGDAFVSDQDQENIKVSKGDLVMIQDGETSWQPGPNGVTIVSYTDNTDEVMEASGAAVTEDTSAVSTSTAVTVTEGTSAAVTDKGSEEEGESLEDVLDELKKGLGIGIVIVIAFKVLGAFYGKFFSSILGGGGAPPPPPAGR